MTTAIITMAGFGRRFLVYVPLELCNCPKVSHHRAQPVVVFLVDAKPVPVYRCGDRLRVYRTSGRSGRWLHSKGGRSVKIRSSQVIQLPAPTDGQATTAMAAKPAIQHTKAPVFIYNIDTFVHPLVLSPADIRGDGWNSGALTLRVTPGVLRPPAADASGRVSEVREKVRISSHATIGLYWVFIVRAVRGSLPLASVTVIRRIWKQVNATSLRSTTR